ncbi:MAG: endolytic transglycosylase MltG, partial [Gammaproteobacteria bacterium]|nr:endolytic transglycosylase MltG [Gammaproteobacteria bacterium]
SLRVILDRMVAGDVLTAEIRFIEGWRFNQLRETIAEHPELRHEAATLSEQALLDRLGIRYEHPEGLFFPSTYRFAAGISDLEVYRMAHEAMRRLLDEAWAAREPGLPLKDPYEALVLASVVEKEAGTEADRALIAGVFVNRLRRGMKLQSDPTTIYGLGDAFDGDLRRVHLRTDTPYNTYTRHGLPPTPIALVGRASLQAVLHPAKTDALYFVARGDGSSQFSVTLDEHNAAVRKYQLGQGR